jgi:hypothetical protein
VPGCVAGWGRVIEPSVVAALLMLNVNRGSTAYRP